MNRLLYLLISLITVIACTNNAGEKSLAALKQLSSPANDSCAEPYLFTDKNGLVYLSWIEKNGKESSLKFSILKNETWAEPITIAAGNNWFVNWADYPVLSADKKGNIIAHFLEKTDTAKFAYDIKLVFSSDSGNSWSIPKVLHDDGKKAEHGFVSMIPYKDGFFTCWLDGRKSGSAENSAGHDGHHGEMTVRAAMLEKSGKKTNEWELDGRVCDCCQTTAAITDNGPIVVYRDRSDDEIRDMSIVRLVNNEWTKPVTIHADNWQIKACPVNGPRADAINNNLTIAWFSMADKKGQVNLIFSKNGGETFSKPVRIDEGKPIGRVDVVLLDSTTAMVSWMEGPEIKAVKVHADGTKESSIMIASSSDARSSGFPQMTHTGNKLIFAWTDVKEKTIKVASLPL